VKILVIRDDSVSTRSDIANAYISFGEMTVSVVAILTDVERAGRPVTGFGFTSNGRYSASGILRSRMIPHLLAAAPDHLLNCSGTNFELARISFPRRTRTICFGTADSTRKRVFCK
jgi:hypothetical protein